MGDERLVRLGLLARKELGGDEPGERLLREHPAREPKTLEKRLHVLAAGVGEVARVDRRRIERVRASAASTVPELFG